MPSEANTQLMLSAVKHADSGKGGKSGVSEVTIGLFVCLFGREPLRLGSLERSRVTLLIGAPYAGKGKV